MGCILKNNYIPSLDGIRTISVFLVVLSHAGLGFIVPGGLGVTIFFFLSGFLITTLLLNEYEKNKHIKYWNFLMRRFFRLFPPLAVTLSVTYLLFFVGLLGGGVSWEGVLAQIFYLSNYHSVFAWPGDLPDGLGILWSLAVEEHFYLFFPLLLYIFLTKFNRNKVAFILVSLCLLVLFWRIYLVYKEHVSISRIYYATDTRIDSILYGCIMATICNPVDKEGQNGFSSQSVFLIFGSVVLLLLSLIIRGDAFRETVRYSIQGIALMPLFYYSVKYSEHPFFSWLNWEWMRTLGVYSYFIYLIHLVVIRSIEYQGISNSIPTKIVLTAIISIAFAFMIDKYIDVHFAKIRKKFRS
jgi:peptidoglycan/LPS O-acetylase OafA/YrhL